MRSLRFCSHLLKFSASRNNRKYLNIIFFECNLIERRFFRSIEMFVSLFENENNHRDMIRWNKFQNFVFSHKKTFIRFWLWFFHRIFRFFAFRFRSIIVSKYHDIFFYQSFKIIEYRFCDSWFFYTDFWLIDSIHNLYDWKLHVKNRRSFDFFLFSIYLIWILWFRNLFAYVRYGVWHQRCIAGDDIMTRLITAELIALQALYYIIVSHVQWYEWAEQRAPVANH